MASKRANSEKLSGPISGVIFPASPFPNPSPLSRSFNDVARLSPASLAAAPLSDRMTATSAVGKSKWGEKVPGESSRVQEQRRVPIAASLGDLRSKVRTFLGLSSNFYKFNK